MPLYTTLIFLSLAFLCSLTLFFRNNVSRYLKLFPFFLLFAVVVESVSEYLVAHRHYNTALLSPATTLYICFYLYTLYQIIHNRRVKKILIWVIIVYPIICAVNILFIQKPPQFHNLTYSLGGFLIVIASIYYFLELFQAEYTVNLLREPAFWICTGLLLFFTYSFYLYGFSGLRANRKFFKYLYVLYDVSDIFLYSLFSIAFLCTIRISKSSS
jgi:hypothetical protein